MSIEAMKQALNALEQHGRPLLNHEDAYSESLNALRQAIEAAEKQEPDELTIAYMSGFFDGKKNRKWIGLTDEEIDVEALKDDHAAYFAVGAIWANKRLREKNT